MTNAARDKNFIIAKTAVLNTTGKDIIRLVANPANHRLFVNDGTIGSDNGPKNAMKDDNDVSTLLAVSSADGETPITLYADSMGRLLINSN